MNLWQHWHRVFQPVVIIVELIIFCSGYAGWIVVCCVGGLMKDLMLIDIGYASANCNNYLNK